jgi:hypothetical protein
VQLLSKSLATTPHAISWRFARPSWQRPRGTEPLDPHAIWDVLIAAALLLGIGVAIFLPANLWLPALSLAALACAALTALFAWHAGAIRESKQLTAWDVAGALTLIGFVAGMVSDSRHVIEFFGV